MTSNISTSDKKCDNRKVRKNNKKDALFTWVRVLQLNILTYLYSLNHCVSVVFIGFHWIVINLLWQQESEFLDHKISRFLLTNEFQAVQRLMSTLLIVVNKINKKITEVVYKSQKKLTHTNSHHWWRTRAFFWNYVGIFLHLLGVTSGESSFGSTFSVIYILLTDHNYPQEKRFQKTDE